MRVTTRSSSGPIGRFFAPIIFSFVGIAMVFISSFMTKQDANARARCTEAVQAEVVSLERSENTGTDSNKPSNAVTPVFEYEYNGQTYQSITGSYSSTYKDKFAVGQNYTVFVDPNDPQEIYSEDIGASDATVFKYLKWGGVVVAVLGVVLFVFSIVKLLVIGGAAGFAVSSYLSKKK